MTGTRTSSILHILFIFFQIQAIADAFASSSSGSNGSSSSSSKNYDLVVIGGGSAGLTAAKFAATFGKVSK